MRISDLITHLQMLLSKYGNVEIDGELYLLGENENSFEDKAEIEFKPKKPKSERDEMT